MEKRSVRFLMFARCGLALGILIMNDVCLFPRILRVGAQCVTAAAAAVPQVPNSILYQIGKSCTVILINHFVQYSSNHSLRYKILYMLN